MRWACSLLLFAGGCLFSRPQDVPDPDAGVMGADARPIECQPGPAVCAAGMLTACDDQGHFIRYQVPNGGASGEAVTVTLDEYPCPLGCAASADACAEPAPSNGLSAAMDDPDTSLDGTDVVIDDISGDTLLVVSNGAPGGQVVLAEADGGEIAVPAVVVPQANGLDIVALKVRSLTVAEGARLKVIGTKAFAIASDLDVYVAGQIDLSGATSGGGMSPTASCSVPMAPGAGGGAGNYQAGGASSTGVAGGTSLAASSPDLSPLEGGCSNFLGIGGGAIQIVSRTRIALATTGVVNVSGRGGQGIDNGGTLYVFGGGSGGGVLLEAPAVVFAQGSRVAGRGGAGAAGNTTNNTFASGTSGDADPAATSVPGGSCTGCGGGGNGGTESSAPGTGTGTGSALGAGGGSVGRCIAATRSGVVLPPSGVMKIHFQSRQLTTR